MFRVSRGFVAFLEFIVLNVFTTSVNAFFHALLEFCSIIRIASRISLTFSNLGIGPLSHCFFRISRIFITFRITFSHVSRTLAYSLHVIRAEILYISGIKLWLIC